MIKGIDRQEFEDQLKLTQEYCIQQLQHTYKNYAAIFRSINPLDDKGYTFKFKFKMLDIVPPVYATLVEWGTLPGDNEQYFDRLFEIQRTFKIKKRKLLDTGKKYKGRILACSLDETLVDGAAALASNGLLDDYNYPPIDTWFYMIRQPNKRILFSWIPDYFTFHVNKGIEVNPEECINWADVWYPDEPLFRPTY
ncbi:hypothetical protein [Chitinophaga tropicalis]|uniref:Uncharacterized protein n=1 Tax=Chitinophaga tropicalis TaxID=2683588 RepID=A0A7K1U5Q1_9BACT|nr:hypothetical protein [Chitinophaga tropicalis]MVT09693.1 hypothetical protein [Chitinophaga tropicalis]